MPKVSIIIPVYNVEKYLDQCVQSAINQTLQDIEIILVDDESPDGCPQMCDEYAKKDSRIKVVHKKNGGLGFARNSGLEVATGEYITFLDSDDYIDYNCYELAYQYIKRFGLDSIYFRCDRFSDTDKIETTIKYNEIKNARIIEGAEIIDFSYNMIANKPHMTKDRDIDVSSCFALYNLSIIKGNKLEFHSERELVSEDLVFNLDYLKCVNKIAICDNKLYHYRINLSSLTRSHRNDFIDRFYKQYEYMTKRYCDNEEALIRIKRNFIGYVRNRIKLIVKSSMSHKEKLAQITYFVTKPYWKEIYSTYPVKTMPFKHRLPFFMIRYKMKHSLMLLCKFI